MVKAIMKLQHLWATQGVQLSMCGKSSSNRKLYKNLLKVGSVEKFMKVFDSHANLPVLEPLMQVHNYALISSES